MDKKEKELNDDVTSLNKKLTVCPYLSLSLSEELYLVCSKWLIERNICFINSTLRKKLHRRKLV